MNTRTEAQRVKQHAFLSPYTVANGWKFHNPVQLHFGDSARQELPRLLAGHTSTLVVTTSNGRQRLHSDSLLGGWSRGADLIWMDQVSENPGLHDLQKHLDALRDVHLDSVVALGGGSTLDTAKVLAAALSPECRGHSLADLLSAPKRPLSSGTIKLVALPTTSGTGSEVTPFATVWDHVRKKKLSLAGPDMFPAEAIIDAELTHALPLDVTVSTGLDAINQASESMWNRNANPITIGLATRSLQLGIPALIELSGGHKSPTARSHLAEASLLAGLAISHTRTALCHSISYPLTAHFGVAHGLACAFSMPSVLKQCIASDDGRLDGLAKNLLGAGASTLDLLDLYLFLNTEMQVVKRVSHFIDDLADLTALIPEMVTPGRADNCMVPVDQRLLMEILEQSWNGQA